MKRTSLRVLLFAAAAAAACSNDAPVAPAAASAVADSSARTPAPSPGTLALSFYARIEGSLQPVTTLNVSSEELILRAFVADSAGLAAQRGTVTFEYCSYKGGPPNDPTRADEAPKEACDQGLASWARLTSHAVNAGTCPTLGTGYACMNFGIVRIPRSVGFRFRYASQGSGVPSATSGAQDFTWVQGS